MLPLIEADFLSPSVRFHGYKATSEEMDQAVSRGMSVFLCDDLKRISYDLTEEEANIVNRCGSFNKEGRTYIKTNIRMERPVMWQFVKHRMFDTLVIFGHGWAFDDDKERLEIILKILYENKIRFV